MITMPPPQSLASMTKAIEQLKTKIAKVGNKREEAAKSRLKNQRKIRFVNEKISELQIEKNRICRRCDFLLNDTNIGPSPNKNRSLSRPQPISILNECFFIALSDDGSQGVICGERLGKVLSSKQIASSIASQNNNFSSIRPNTIAAASREGVSTHYRHPPTNLLHNTVCPDWSEVNAALGYAALLIRIMFDSWKADDMSDKCDEVLWTILPRGNNSRIIK